VFDQHNFALLLAWSGLAVLLSWLLPARWRMLAVAGCGAGLLASQSQWSLVLLLSGVLSTFLVHRLCHGSKAATIAGIVAIVGVFLSMTVSGASTGEGISSGVLLPLGMAFYSLRLIHYLLESYKGNLRAHDFDEYLCYQLLPSTLPVGPIHRFDEFLRDLRRRRWDSGMFSGGLERILYGLAKLVVIGNYLVEQKLAVAISPSLHAHGFIGIYSTAWLFWIRLYVLFSAYSDIAIGFGALMGFGLRENFNWPMLARNIGEFWRRWHMSLSAWCRDYVFTPALSLTRSHVVAVVSAMVVLGLWHEFSLRYLLWGGYHGLGIAVYRWFDQHAGKFFASLPGPLRKLWHGFAIVLTLHFVIFSFAITSAVERFILGR
jgi:D-alanyl-lipoteichoic acid acyltransferase DltB (MBOAT superfamily)